MSKLRDALAAAIEAEDLAVIGMSGRHMMAADGAAKVIAGALPPDLIAYIEAREPLIELVAAALSLNAFATWSALNRPETERFLRALRDPRVLLLPLLADPPIA